MSRKRKRLAPTKTLVLGFLILIIIGSIHAVQVDSTNEISIKKLGLNKFDVVLNWL